MAGLSNFAEDQILEGYFGAAAISLPATLYMALSSTAPADDGTNVSEPVGNNYARKAVSNIPGNWTAPAGTGQTDNVNDVVFNQATGGAWGIMNHLAIFDVPAGGNMLSGRVGAFYATDSHFESGYGRSPGRGMLFDIRGALIARLEGCTVRGPLYTPYNRSSSSAAVFSNCAFLEMDPRKKAELEEPRSGVRLIECTFDYMPEGSSAPARKVTEINETW